jgi:hypothetical protein
MRVPGGEERTGDRNVKFAGEFPADRPVMRRTMAPATATSRATTLPGTRKGYAAAPKTAQAPSIRSRLPVDAL